MNSVSCGYFVKDPDFIKQKEIFFDSAISNIIISASDTAQINTD